MDEKIIIIAVSAAMVIFELIPLFREKQIRIASVYTVLLSLGVILFFIADSGLKIPGINNILKAVAERI